MATFVRITKGNDEDQVYINMDHVIVIHDRRNIHGEPYSTLVLTRGEPITVDQAATDIVKAAQKKEKR